MENVRANLVKHIDEMCKYPTRHAGSSAERQTAEYIKKVFLSYGLKVREEEFKIRGWEFNSFSLFNVSKGKQVPCSICCHFSASVNAEQQIMMIGVAQAKEIENYNVKDQIVFVSEVIGNVFDNNDFALKLEKMGATAVIFFDHNNECGLPSSKICRSSKTQKIGVCAVGAIGAMFLAANRTDVYRLQIDAKPYDTTTTNVIGYVQGGTKKAVFGGHYDAAPCVEGAGDDASGVAMCLELARLLKDKANGYTLEFCAFSAEEYMDIRGTYPPGSGDYVYRHKGEDIRWFMNLDDYSGPEPYRVDLLGVGHLDKLPEIEWPMPPVRAQLSGDDVTFFGEGIPTIWLGDRKMFAPLHTVADTRDLIDFDRMVGGTKKMYDMAVQLLKH